MSATIGQLLEKAAEAVASGGKAAFCLLAKTTGSSPASAGAIMLVSGDGETHGTIGGGCVEASVVESAKDALIFGKGIVQTIPLDHNFAWKEGLICGGTIEVVIALATDAEKLAAVAKEYQNRVPTKLELAIEDRTWTLNLPPRPHVYIVGAGHLGQDVCRHALSLDFSVSVFDDRDDMLKRFIPEEATHIHGNIAETLASVPYDDETYTVIVTRGHRDDAVALHAVAGKGAGYVGMVGSKRKIGLTFNELKDKGVSQEFLKTVHAPIGMDIGAQTVSEIALSIAAQLVEVRRNKPIEPTVLCPGSSP
ncbi:MAG: XdhC family protein [Planctomycetes bacterium]|nr:XdhC family protein [Planctomycetota bacterium]